MSSFPSYFVCITGWGFVLALVAMLVAAIVEIVRLDYAPTPGGYSDSSAVDNITPCQNIDDYDPNQFQNWWQVSLAFFILMAFAFSRFYLTFECMLLVVLYFDQMT